MGMDVGDRNIGLAVTDKNNKVAYPLDVLKNGPGIRSKIKEIVNEKDIDKIVVGIPFNLKGEAGHQANKVLRFIGHELEGLGAQIVKYDERFTTKIPLKQKKGKVEHVDKYSACILLNDYISHYEK